LETRGLLTTIRHSERALLIDELSDLSNDHGTEPTNSNTQFSVAVTSMLTLIAYRYAVDSQLPRLPYMTRLDVFFVGPVCRPGYLCRARINKPRSACHQ